MDIELIVQDSESGKIYDISELASAIQWETTILEQPGKLTFECIDDGTTQFYEGSVIRLKVNGSGVFYGYLFTRKRSETKKIQITAYDALRYLQNKDTYVFPSMTSSEIFEMLCKAQKLRYRIADASTYKCAPATRDNKSYYEMIQKAQDETLINAGKWYVVRDVFGILEHVEVTALRTNWFIGDANLLTGYEYESSIDSETYNQVKVIREVKDPNESKKIAGREVYVLSSSENISKWGLLQHFEKVDEKLNTAQLKQRANQMLKLYNRKTKTLKMRCIGVIGIRAGSSVIVGISDLKDEKIPDIQYAIVSSCTHNFDGDQHTMTLTLQLAEAESTSGVTEQYSKSGNLNPVKKSAASGGTGSALNRQENIAQYASEAKKSSSRIQSIEKEAYALLKEEPITDRINLYKQIESKCTEADGYVSQTYQAKTAAAAKTYSAKVENCEKEAKSLLEKMKRIHGFSQRSSGTGGFGGGGGGFR